VSTQAVNREPRRTLVPIAAAILGVLAITAIGYAQAQSGGQSIVDNGPLSEDPPVGDEAGVEEKIDDAANVYREAGPRADALRSEVAAEVATLVESNVVNDAEGPLGRPKVNFAHDITYHTGTQAEQVQFSLGEKAALTVVRQEWSPAWEPFDVARMGSGSKSDTLGDGTEVGVRTTNDAVQIIAIKGETMLVLIAGGAEGEGAPLTLKELKAIAEALTKSIPA
jgi:hypothetical protein